MGARQHERVPRCRARRETRAAEACDERTRRPWPSPPGRRTAYANRGPGVHAPRQPDGVAGRGPYFLPMGTVRVPVGETQPAAEISVTESVTLPLVPAVKVIRLVPRPAVIVPFEMLQL